MIAIAVISSKGGGGKSIFTFTLAVLLAHKGHNVAIADVETNHSCTLMAERRKEQQRNRKNLPSVAVHSIPIETFSDSFQKLMTPYDIVVIDADPLTEQNTHTIVQFANFILVPSYASPFYIDPACIFIDLLQKYQDVLAAIYPSE